MVQLLKELQFKLVGPAGPLFDVLLDAMHRDGFCRFVQITAKTRRRLCPQPQSPPP